MMRGVRYLIATAGIALAATAPVGTTAASTRANSAWHLAPVPTVLADSAWHLTTATPNSDQVVIAMDSGWN